MAYKNEDIPIYVYDSTEQYDPGLFVYYSSNKFIERDFTKATAIVSGVSSVINDDGDTYFNIKYYMNGKAESNVVSDASVPVFSVNKNFPAKLISGLVIGDIIQFTTNNNGQIDQVKLLYSSDYTGTDYERINDGIKEELGYDAYEILYVGYGRVQKMLREKIAIKINNYTRVFRYGGTVYIYDQATKKIKVGSKNDISVDDKIFVRTTTNILNDIIVFR